MADRVTALMKYLDAWKAHARERKGTDSRREESHGAGLIEQTIELLHRLPEDKQRIVYHFVKALAGKA